MQGRVYRTDIKDGDVGKTVNRLSYPANDGEKLSNTDAFAQAEIAKERSAIATLGYDPNKVTAEHTRLNISGAYDKRSDRILWVDGEPGAEATLIHESLHRGIEKLRQQSPEAKKILAAHDEEQLVRYVMATKMGDPEAQPQWPTSTDQRNEAVAWYKKYPHLVEEISKLEDIAANLHKDQRPRGPR